MTDVTGTEPESEGETPADDATVDDTAADAPEVEEAPEIEEAPDVHALDERHAELLERLQAELGEAVLDQEPRFGDPVVRIRRDSWRRAGEFVKSSLGCDYLSFISAIDWHPAPREGDEDSGDTSSPVQPQEITYGAAGSDGRFQVFAHVQSTSRHVGLTLKVDVDETAMLAQSWVEIYAGADWHERECWEMFGVIFEGHPALRHLYLPSEFEGHPLRKDFALLSRVVKPWPGLVDVEPMPEEEAADETAGEAAGESRRRRSRCRVRGRIMSTTNPPLPDIQVDPRIYRHLADAQVNVELDTGDMILNLGPQHPATHGTLRIVVRLDGERVIAADPVIGYMHRGYEKLTEFRTYPQITTLINRIDWLSSFANEVPFIDAAEQLLGIEAPPRAQYIRTILTELSRIATFLLFLGEMGLQVGALTPAFYGFRDREHILNLIEAATGGRFHPNFNRIGGLKDDLPWGWINDTRTAMKTTLDACDTFDNLVAGNEIFEMRTRSIGIIPAELGAAYGVSGSNLRASGVDWDLRRDGKPFLAYPDIDFRVWTHPDGDSFARVLGAAPGDARVGPHGPPAARQAPERQDHGEGAAHHQGAAG